MVKLYCVGDNNVDIYQSLGKVFPGGCCLNVAIYARMLGHEAAFVSAVGSDRLGQLQLDTLRLYGVDTSGVHITDGHTAWCKILHQGNDLTQSVVGERQHVAPFLLRRFRVAVQQVPSQREFAESFVLEIVVEEYFVAGDEIGLRIVALLSLCGHSDEHKHRRCQ